MSPSPSLLHFSKCRRGTCPDHRAGSSWGAAHTGPCPRGTLLSFSVYFSRILLCLREKQMGLGCLGSGGAASCAAPHCCHCAIPERSFKCSDKLRLHSGSIITSGKKESIELVSVDAFVGQKCPTACSNTLPLGRPVELRVLQHQSRGGRAAGLWLPVLGTGWYLWYPQGGSVLC